MDVVDLGVQDTGFKDERTGENKFSQKIEVVWQVSERMSTGLPFIVSQRYTLSFADYPKPSNLRTLVDAWGIDLQHLIDDTNEYDVERLIGLPCLLNVTHNESKKKPGQFFANVGSIMPLLKGMTPMEPEGYTRRAERPKAAPAHSLADFPEDDEQMPWDPDDPGPA